MSRPQNLNDLLLLGVPGTHLLGLRHVRCQSKSTGYCSIRATLSPTSRRSTKATRTKFSTNLPGSTRKSNSTAKMATRSNSKCRDSSSRSAIRRTSLRSTSSPSSNALRKSSRKSRKKLQKNTKQITRKFSSWNHLEKIYVASQSPQPKKNSSPKAMNQSATSSQYLIKGSTMNKNSTVSTPSTKLYQSIINSNTC